MDAIYTDPALVPLYDLINGGDFDLRFYRAELPPPPAHIVDLGCGTGRFAIDISRFGYAVTAIDPAPVMIAFARALEGSGNVDWINGTAADIPASKPADAILMMGHAFQCLLTDHDMAETCRHAKAALSAGGRFLFESRNPLRKAWLAWNGRSVLRDLSEDAGAGKKNVEIDRKVLAVEENLVTFEEAFHLADRTIISRSTLRFADKNMIETTLRKAGFQDIQVFGFWDRRPYDEDSPEMIFSAR